uniref:Endonuclease-reverse transcriptase n=1 Tax=Heliothis virescens TaxID=7102 RepID=A0A2A4JJB3_HELVI
MDEQFQLLFDKMKIEMQSQTSELANKILNKMDEKLKPVLEANQILKTKVEELEKRVELLEREKRSNNIIVHGLAETEHTTLDLTEYIGKYFLNEIGVTLEKYEINKIYRIGQINKEKTRPILLSLVSGMKKIEIMRNKKKLKDIYITEDYSKETLEIRKSLQPKLMEERKKGNFAYIKYDKLVVKESSRTTDKRKREKSTTPQDELQPRKQQTLTTPKNSRVNAFELMRARSNSLTTTSSETKQ